MQGDYVDGRYDAPEGKLDANLGRMPIAQIGDEYIGQSAALNYYFAAENGLLGSNNLEAAQIIAVTEHVKEMMTAFRNIVKWGEEPTTEALDKWFNEGATDVSGPAAREGQSTRYLTWWMGRMEADLGDKGFAVGNKLSLADVMLFYVFADVLTEGQAKPDAAAWRKEPFCSKERTDAALAKHPKLKAAVDAVLSNEGIQKHLANRGVQGF